MTQDDIIFMARASGWMSEYESSIGFSAEAAFKFASLVASAERKEIIAMAESSEFNRMHGEFSPTSYDLVRAIKDRK
jgi:hypothetical protein